MVRLRELLFELRGVLAQRRDLLRGLQVRPENTINPSEMFQKFKIAADCFVFLHRELHCRVSAPGHFSVQLVDFITQFGFLVQ